MASPPPMAPFADRYRLNRPLGEGGMALVVLGHDLTLDVPRAIKILLPALARKRSLRERFQAEARIMAKLEHPHIVRVFDVGAHDRLPYIAMEALPGGSLEGWVEVHGALPAAQAVRVVLELCDAVEHAHRHGVIHRDIKPHNVLVAPDGAVKLTDFGIARTDLGSTRTGTAMGTLGYVAPEQLANAKAATPAADVYSLAVTLWRLVTAGAVESLAYELDHGALDPLPGPLRDALAPALAQRMEQRTPDVASLRGRLAEALPRLPQAAPVSLVHVAHTHPDDCPSWAGLVAELAQPTPTEDEPLPEPAPLPPPPRTPAAPIERAPEVHRPYVVRLTEEDIDATLKAREARRLRGREASASDEPTDDRLKEALPDDEGWARPFAGVLKNTARWMGVGLIMVAVFVGLLNGLVYADTHLDLRGHRAALARSASSLADTVLLEGPGAVRDRQEAKDARAEELFLRYQAVEDAPEGPAKAEAAERFVEAVEIDVALALPEDPAAWTPEQRAEVERLLRLKQALGTYQVARERVEGPPAEPAPAPAPPAAEPPG